jgi:hypothetical protein
MYAGRSVSDAKHVAALLAGPLHVVSAGLGLVAASDAVAPYDLTASGPRAGLQQVLRRFGATPAQWWNLLCEGRGLSALLARHPKATVMLALPSNYVEMVSPDLSACRPAERRRLRLFSSPAGASTLPEDLVGIVMPYDERLESVAGHAGTRADFAQRAMRHFVQELGAHTLDQGQAREVVHRALAPYQKPRTVERQRCDDQAIKKLIRSKWVEMQGRNSSLLRYLRDEALISCEQGRFAQLWREVRLEKVRQ